MAGRRGPVAVSQTPLSAQLSWVEPTLPVAEPEIERMAVPPPAPPRERKKAAPAAAPGNVEAAGHGGGLDIPDPTYYGVRQLDVFPVLASAFDLRYPARASAEDVKGRVALLVLIDAEGNVNDVSVVESQPAGYFEEDALRTLRAARFKPARKSGRPVKSRIVIEINYGGG